MVTDDLVLKSRFPKMGAVGRRLTNFYTKVQKYHALFDLMTTRRYFEDILDSLSSTESPYSLEGLQGTSFGEI